MADRSSRPGRMPRQTGRLVVEHIAVLRRQTLHRQADCQGGGRLRRPPSAGRTDRALPARSSRRDDPSRHQEARPLRAHRPPHHCERKGQSNGRGIGWEYVHVAIDDASRIAFSQILPNERQDSAVAFLNAAVAYYAGLGVTVARVMRDNGACYKSKAFARACHPYTPKTNGKAERFIQTALREWAYAAAYPTSQHRAAELPVWLHRYNSHRPHARLKSKTPISPRPDRGQPVEAPQLAAHYRADHWSIHTDECANFFGRTL